MKKRKFVSVFMLCLILTSTIVLPVQAAPAEEGESETAQIACYDMAQGGTQVFEVVDENGEWSTITVTQLPADAREADGVYQIEQDKLSWKAGYKIKVSNNKITSAYAPYFEEKIGQITNTRLLLESSKQASYYLVHTLLGKPYNTGVRSIIDNGQIKVSEI